MQKIRKILKGVSEKAALPTNQPTNQPVITKNTDFVRPDWRRSKNLSESIFFLNNYVLADIAFTKWEQNHMAPVTSINSDYINYH